VLVSASQLTPLLSELCSPLLPGLHERVLSWERHAMAGARCASTWPAASSRASEGRRSVNVAGIVLRYARGNPTESTIIGVLF